MSAGGGAGVSGGEGAVGGSWTVAGGAVGVDGRYISQVGGLDQARVSVGAWVGSQA